MIFPQHPTKWIADLTVPEWDAYFMGMAFYVSMRSNDQQTKVGSLIVDWPSKQPIGQGYNGHIRKTNNLPTMREGSVKIDSLKVGNVEYVKGECIPKECRDNYEYLQGREKDQIQGYPDKYPFMVHGDANAIGSVRDKSSHAVGYLPFLPCENCLLSWLNDKDVIIKRIVTWGNCHAFGNTELLLQAVRDSGRELTIEQWAEDNDEPIKILENAAMYMRIRRQEAKKITVGVATTYR